MLRDAVAANVRIINEVFKKGDLHVRLFHLPTMYIESTSLSTAIKAPFLKISLIIMVRPEWQI
jgi:hypothetical protein